MPAKKTTMMSLIKYIAILGKTLPPQTCCFQKCSQRSGSCKKTKDKTLQIGGNDSLANRIWIGTPVLTQNPHLIFEAEFQYLAYCANGCFGLPWAQNHGMTEVGRDFWRSCGPSPLLKQGHLESAAEDRIQATFEYIQGLGTPQPLWATCSSAQPASQKKKSVSWCSARLSFVSVCAYHLLFCHWV